MKVWWDVYMWIDDHITIQVLAEDQTTAITKAGEAIEERLGKDVSYGVMDINEVMER